MKNFAISTVIIIKPRIFLYVCSLSAEVNKGETQLAFYGKKEFETIYRDGQVSKETV